MAATKLDGRTKLNMCLTQQTLTLHNKPICGKEDEHKNIHEKQLKQNKFKCGKLNEVWNIQHFKEDL